MESQCAYRCSYDAETALLGFERDLKDAVKSLGPVESEMNDLRRQILELETRRAVLNESKRKARENIKRIEIEISTAKIEFWRLRNEKL